MKVWCSGSATFCQNVGAFLAVEALSSQNADAPSRGDSVLLELDQTDLSDPITRIEVWSKQKITVVVACEASTMKLATQAVRAGAQHIAVKPLEADDLELLTETTESPEMDIEDVAAWRARFAPEIVGNSSALFEALEIASQAADCDCPVLITGESGTGKEFLARAFHRASLREAGPFIPVNCPAIPKELVESELFGHTKGAFTGATNARLGRFAAADTGTLFLDEIGEMDLNVQSKLLRVLQDFQITRVGESRPVQVNVRVIAATNRDLEDLVTKGSFREDLFYRLNVIQVHLPPLRERREDIPMLVDHFISDISEKRQLAAPKLTARAKDALSAYHWPGNIRQLRNVIERMVILRRGRTVDIKHLPNCVTCGCGGGGSEGETAGFASPLELPKDGIDLREALQNFEDTMIRQALMSTGGNKNQAAKILGLNRTTLVEKLRKRTAPAA